MDKIYTLGIDIGSTSSKCVVMADGSDVVSSAIIEKGAGTDGVDIVLEKALGDAGITMDDIKMTISTGYGRKEIITVNKDME